VVELTVKNFSISIVTATHNRPEALVSKALPSILQQTDRSFEWIVINDGADPLTRQIIQQLQPKFEIIYLEIEHPKQGFGLAHARNHGLQKATGEIICYLDDDNALAPTYIEETKSFFQTNPQMACAMVQQSRHRDIYQNRQLIRQGQKFISPKTNTSVAELIRHQQLFDSNGFAHRRSGARAWNPDYRIFVDYEYFLRCLDYWGMESFALYESVLVDYVQSSEGIIGRSKYGEWAEEIDLLCTNAQKYPILSPEDMIGLSSLARSWREKQEQGKKVGAFALKAPAN
jgi:glycosyltransferase involved in cell wall biosynthesis